MAASRSLRAKRPGARLRDGESREAPARASRASARGRRLHAAIGRRQFQHRRIVIVRDTSDAADALEKCDARRVISSSPMGEDPPGRFYVSGPRGAVSGHGARIVRERAGFSRCAKTLHRTVAAGPRSRRGPLPSQPTGETMTATAVAQPAIFAVEYALAMMWQSWGIEPAAMLGHSVGEFTAACLAGVFTLEEAITLLAGRARLMQEVPAGAMLAVRLSESDLRPRLRAGVELAAINSPRLCVVSGPREMIAAFAEEMAAASVACAPLQTSHAFHSAMMEPVVAPLTELAQRTRFHAPRIPLVFDAHGRCVRGLCLGGLLGAPTAPACAIRRGGRVRSERSRPSRSRPRHDARAACAPVAWRTRNQFAPRIRRSRSVRDARSAWASLARRCRDRLEPAALRRTAAASAAPDVSIRARTILD